MTEQFLTLETPRLILNRLDANDIPQIIRYAANKKISDVTTNILFPYTEQDAIYWINLSNLGYRNGTHAIFAIRLKTDHEFIGGTGLTIERKSNRAELGYWLAEPFWGKGYMTEAAISVVRFGFAQLNLNKITSSHFAVNPASGKVMAKVGMRKEGELREHVLKKGIYHDLILYGLSKKQFSQSKAI